MSKVYFHSIDSYSKTEEISKSARELLEKVVAEENIEVEKNTPVKVHFGEKGNTTFITPDNFQGIFDYLKDNNIDSSFIETNVLYKGERTTKDSHIALAKKHGFTQLPIIIADGDHGEDYDEIEINKNRFQKCKLGKAFSDYSQFIVVSHFKGHVSAGFGGALKQLAMGFAARGGKLDQHANNKPNNNKELCTACGLCVESCDVDAITVTDHAEVDLDKCVGCAACIAVCPTGALGIDWDANKDPNVFFEKIAEYAYAAAKDKKNIYIQFAFNLTSGCDCMGQEMEPIAQDMGVFVSTDPVAMDTACMDMTDEKEGKAVFSGRHTLEYAEEIGLGSREYEIVEV